MIFQYFILGNLVSLCMKIINSVVVVGLYYGFLTTFSMGPSYLFLLRARIIEEGIEKKVSATTGFITGQLMMFISIYYAPLHLALGRPYTITVLALPYLLFHFFWNNHKHFFDYGSTTRNSMRNLSIQCVFLNNLIFQLFNHFILPSSMLVRLVNIYMFRCNNKILFVTSSFVGWLIGHILFMKWVGLVLVWIQQNDSIRFNVLIRSNMARIFSILLFITCVYYLGRVPSPIITKKLKETSETEERGESEEETDVEIETTSETKGTKQEQEESTEEDPSPSLFSEEKEDPDKMDETEKIRMNGKGKTKDEFHFKETRYKNRPIYETSYLDGNQENSKLEIFQDKKDKEIFWFEKPLVNILFDYKQWKRPFRYIKNDRFENKIENEMSQYFFHTCQSDGKERISFTYPPSLSTFFEMIQRKMSFFTIEKISYNELYNHWNYTNEQKRKNISNQFLNRVEILDNRFLPLDIIEKRIRLCNCNNETKQEYLPKICDSLFNGPFRGQIKKLFLLPIIKTSLAIKHYIETILINNIHGILLTTNYTEFDYKFTLFDRKSLSTEMSYFLNIISKFGGKSTSNLNLKGLYLFPENKQVRINPEDPIKIFKFLINAVITDTKDKTISKEYIGIKEINKKVPRWSYKLIDELEQQEVATEESGAEDYQIRSRKAKRVVIFTNSPENTDTNEKETDNSDQDEEVALIRYSQQPDFRRDIIKGSIRAQRRKIIILELFQANVYSALFLDRVDKPPLFSFDIPDLMKIIFINLIWKKNKLKISDHTKEKTKESEKEEENKREIYKKEEKTRIEIGEIWDSIIFAQVIRGFALVIQSILRKYIILPSLIISKNLVRILLFQFPEWSEDLKDWTKEIHIKCTYNGVQLSETEFPKNWLTDGIQIKILFPFRLKPWHRSKLRFPNKDPIQKKEKKEKNDFCFLTVWGMETELPFGSPRQQISFFEPIYKKLKKIKLKLQKKCFLVLRVLKERTKFFLNVLKETKKWVIKSILFLKKLKKRIKELSKRNQILAFVLKKIERYKLSEPKKEKDSIIHNQIIPESSIQIRFMDCATYSLTEKKMKNLTNRTNTIITEIEKMKKDKQIGFLTREINISQTKISYEDKRLESPKNIWRILKRKNLRLLRKLHFFFKFLIEKLYIYIFLCIIILFRIIAELLLKLKNKNLNKYIYNNEENQERIDKTNQSIINFILTIKKSLCIINKNSHIFWDLSYLSQAYVFYKFSQIQVSNLYKLRSVFNYYGTSFFLKNEIKEYFVGTQGIFDSELRQHKNLRNSLINEWKNWLKVHYQYDLSQIRWSRLISQKWRNRVNQYQCRMTKNKDLNKCDSDEKNRFIEYEKQNSFEIYSLLKKNKKLKKQYQYDLLSYKSINYEDEKNSYIYGLPLQVNKNKKIYYTYNNNTPKRKLFDMIEGILIKNYRVENNSIDIKKSPDRKCFYWKILNFCLSKKIDIKACVNIDTITKRNQNTKISVNNYQIIEKFDKKKKGLFYLTIHQEIHPFNQKQKKSLADWMRMNDEIPSRPISNFAFLLFPEFGIFYNTYKIKPWAIPIKLLLFNFNVNQNVNKHKSITEKKKISLFLFSKKKTLKFENRNQGEKELVEKPYIKSALSNKKKDGEQSSPGSDMKKRRKKKQYKTNIEAELEFFLKKYLRFQWRWNDSLNQRIINNIKVYCLLLRLNSPNEIAISAIQRKEMNPHILMIQKDLTLTELIKRGIFIIEPVRLFVKNDGQFYIYQTIGISLVHKNKHQINQRYLEKSYGYADTNKKNFYESIAIHQKMTGNIDKNNYDLLVLENILSPKRRRELRIQIFLNYRDINSIHRNTVFFNGNRIKNCVLNKKKNLDNDKKKLIKLKFFLWSNYRLEDLACMNRYWFDTNNGSRFSMTRIHMYPRLQIY
uniref:Protein TIC 214 n=1 Tax=Juglans regia TaxID=51240 RepID=A0A288XRM4_JUGRE|nr:hypothetical chloroplast RF19 [Juglans regia]QIJ58966.1 hypothetical chloroplast RF19 [Juglans regia]QIJ59050.1 hypothetical chloroplast RF19 [Juglans regia]QIJ59134.1 hypothetical chloroplast RF19 [Juglans regia]QIJ59218.1 hypothetical chloroplast RF19 [Juglans regia]